MGIRLGDKISLLTFFILLVSFKALSQEHWPLYDIANQHWQPTDSSSAYYMILKNNKTCIDCYKTLSAFFSKAAPDAVVYCVTVSDSSVLERKLNYKQIVQLMPHLKAVLFDYENTSGDILTHNDLRRSSPFYEYNVDITPALIKIKNGRVSYYSYRQIFDNGDVKPTFEKLLFDN